MTLDVEYETCTESGQRGHSVEQVDYVRAWVAHLRRRNLAASTIKRRRTTGRRFEMHCDGTGINVLAASTAFIRDWLDGLAVAPQTRGHYRGDLHSLYTWAVTEHHLADNPVDGVETPKRPRYLPRPISDGDLRVALELAPPKMRMMLALAAYAGLRSSEITALDVTDLDRSAGTLFVRQGKGGRDRVVPISALLETELSRYGVPRHGPVCPTEDGRNYKRNSVSAIGSAYLHSVGVHASLHQLRHWFATAAYDGTGDLRAVQELLGHSSPQTTALYTKVNGKAVRAAVEAVAEPCGSA